MQTIHAQILATGDELTTGTLVDSNSAYMAEQLEMMGVSVRRHVTVGDDMDDLVRALKDIGEQADVALVTGGLGPTMDDLSAEAAAKAAGVDLELDEEALAWIEALFKSVGRNLGRNLGESNRKQAYFPQGSVRLDNPVGTAPGFSLIIGKCRFFFMPGVPREMKLMLADQVIPRIEEMLEDVTISGMRTICTYGMPEARVGELIADVADGEPGMKIGLRASFPVIQVKIYARAESKMGVERILDEGTDKILDRLKNNVFSVGGRNMEEVVGLMLKDEKATLAVAESCTGGQIAHWLTSVPGSSEYFVMSAVTYANTAKETMLNVSRKTLLKYGAVHEETAKAMAEGARQIAKTTYGISTSGVAGPAGGDEEKPVGTVCIALATPDDTFVYRFHSPFGERDRNIKIFAMNALDVLRRHLQGLPPPSWAREYKP
ncbi:CinA family nicotinamide mononucleotide deamidase-related protein [Desulfatibacillum aliphaticivorans]|uniref:CinA family nicotinamide mononucleotide deamidase-related protein n=1 Tax=Desulfatibacillum aliphaticivorans TaxID=218208 RepID=UPI0003F4FAAB|nr:CinA family nicotinamide mononucleotide deamidase-related protein [Desulfatibacillum aliphaticivorans]